MTRSGIIAGGCWIVDRIKAIHHYPPSGTLISILKESRRNGGAPFNVLIDLAKLQAPFPLEAIGLLGDDDDASFVITECHQHSIDTSQLHKKAGMSTSYTDVMADQQSGRRTFFHHHGANAFLSAEDFDFALTNAKHFHLGYLLLLQTLDQFDPEYGTVAARVLASAQHAGLSTSIDVVSEDSERFESIVLPSLSYSDVVFMNEFELGRTTGSEIVPNAATETFAKASEKLFESGLKGIAVIHTATQAFAFKAGGEIHRRSAASVANVVGTVGAGDAFAAGFLLGWHDGHTLEKCLEFATVSAASSLCGEGASDAVLSLDEATKQFSH
jgi:sugar/nucleoside kinase (ribokinase family)